jgi:hypothetical protein
MYIWQRGRLIGSLSSRVPFISQCLGICVDENVLVLNPKSYSLWLNTTEMSTHALRIERPSRTLALRNTLNLSLAEMTLLIH